MPTKSDKPDDDVNRKVQSQLSASYWDRVGREAAIRRAAVGGTPAGDQRARDINDFLAPPGPRIDAPAGAAYQRGGMVKKGSYTTPAACGGSKIIKTWSK